MDWSSLESGIGDSSAVDMVTFRGVIVGPKVSPLSRESSKYKPFVKLLMLYRPREYSVLSQYWCAHTHI